MLWYIVIDYTTLKRIKTRRYFIAIEEIKRMGKGSKLTYVCLVKEPIFPKKLKHISVERKFDIELVMASYNPFFFILSLLYVNLSLLSSLRSVILKRTIHFVVVHSVEYFPFFFITLLYTIIRSKIFTALKSVFLYDFVDLYLLVNHYPAKSIIHKLLFKFESFLVKEADILTVASDRIKDYLRKTYPSLTMEKIIRLPCGVPNYFFHTYNNEVLKNIRKEFFNASLDDVVLVYVGNTLMDFGLSNIVTASITYLENEERKKIRIVIIGPESNQIICTKMIAKKYGLNMISLGFVPHPQLPKLLQACDVGFFLPPPNAPFVWQMDLPLKIAEYLASGLDILVTRFGNLSKTLESLSIPKEKIFFSSRDESEIAKNLKQIIEKKSISQCYKEPIPTLLKNLERKMSYEYHANRLLTIILQKLLYKVRIR